MNYKRLGGTNWVNNVLLVTGLFCGPVLATFSYLNTVAIFYRSTAALPFGTIVVIILIWALVTFPLTVLGGIVAKNSKQEFNAPCRWGGVDVGFKLQDWHQMTITLHHKIINV